MTGPTLTADTERIVLGAMMLAPRVIDDICEIVTGADFADPRHEVVFDAITALQASGRPVDQITVADHLQTGGHLGRVGGLVAVHDMVGSVPTAANGPWYAERVRSAAVIRRVHQAGQRLQQLAEGADATDATDALDTVNAARAELDAIVAPEHQDVPNERAVYDAIEALDDPPGLATPWPSLTKLIAGLKPGGLYVVGSRPAVGKSSVAAAFVLDAARRGQTGVMFSLEMTKPELYHRLLAAVGEVDMGRIQHRTLQRDDHERIAKAAAHIARLPLVIDDRSDLSVAQIRARVRSVRRRRPVGVVVVDYLGLLRPPAGVARNDRRVQVDAISRSLKVLAKDMQVPVVALAQLNRMIETRAVKAPLMSDLRESGAIEQDADVVILLHRDPDDESMGTDLHLMVGKNRHGPQGRVTLNFRGHYARIDDMSEQWTPSGKHVA